MTNNLRYFFEKFRRAANRAYGKQQLIRCRLAFLFGKPTSPEPFKDIEKVCFFIGYPRSGSTLTGSLLDAHPEAIIANELGGLEYFNAGINRDQLYTCLLDNSRRSAQLHRRGGGDYYYEVPGQWQGRFCKLRVIGDKQIVSTMKMLSQHPELLDRFKSLTGDKPKFIQVIRNPFDTISTIARRRSSPLDEAINYFFMLCETTTRVKQKISPQDCIEVHHEDMIADPKACLTTLCQFLDLEVLEDYLKDCASLVYTYAHRSRLAMDWDSAHIKVVEAKITQFPFLDGYLFEM